MTDDDELLLENLQAEMASDQANSLLDRQLGRARQWIQMRKANGDPVNLYEFTKQCMSEPNKRHHMIIAHCAAMWRLIHQGDR